MTSFICAFWRFCAITEKKRSVAKVRQTSHVLPR